jgi:hypothetical protein
MRNPQLTAGGPYHKNARVIYHPANAAREKSHERTRNWMYLILLILVLIAVLAGPARAAGNARDNFGIGVILGSPSGISLKIPQGAQSINVIAGWDIHNDDPPGPPCCNDYFYIGGDYVWYNYNLIHVSQGRLPLYYGPGIYAAFSKPRNVVGFRFPVGLEYQFATAPFDIFLELGPRVNIVPATDVDIFVGLGARFFF